MVVKKLKQFKIIIIELDDFFLNISNNIEKTIINYNDMIEYGSKYYELENKLLLTRTGYKIKEAIEIQDIINISEELGEAKFLNRKDILNINIFINQNKEKLLDMSEYKLLYLEIEKENVSITLKKLLMEISRDRKIKNEYEIIEEINSNKYIHYLKDIIFITNKVIEPVDNIKGKTLNIGTIKKINPSVLKEEENRIEINPADLELFYLIL